MNELPADQARVGGLPEWAARLDPELVASAVKQPIVSLSDPLKARRSFARASRLSRALLDAGLPVDELTIEDSSFPAADGYRVPVRWYRPKAIPGLLPVLVYFHGGAFVAGDLETDHARCARLAVGAGCAVLSVHYRQPPEHRFPVPLADCAAAVEWVAASADSLGIDPARIAIGGVSAGGTLAAGVALTLRDESDVRPVLQMLLFPALDDRLESSSVRRYPVTAGWDVADSVHMWRHYLGDTETSPYATPGRAQDLAGVAPALVVVAEVDALRDEAIDYAERMMRAGVPVELHHFPSAFHAFDVAVPDSTLAIRALDAQYRALRSAFRQQQATERPAS